MRLATKGTPTDELQTLIEKRFAEFNSQSTPSRGRKYPAQLRDLIRRGHECGIPRSQLQRLSGMSSTAIRYTLSKAHPPKARRLEVVNVSPEAPLASMPLIIRLPSGVSIELPSAGLLTASLLDNLSQIGANHASSR